MRRRLEAGLIKPFTKSYRIIELLQSSL